MLRTEDVFKDILLQDDGNGDGYTLGDYIETEHIETYLCFFDSVPDTDKKEVLENFINFIYEYQSGKDDFTKEIYESYIPSQKHLKPQREIDKDLNTLKEYAAMLRRLYGLGKGGGLLMNIPEEVHTALMTTERLISDLENKEFKVIGRSKYFNQKDPTKNDLRAFLKDTYQKYNLKSMDAKQLLDAI